MRVKFEIGSGSGHPHVPVFVNGQGPFTFTLDTGAVATTISKSMAETLGIPIREADKKFAAGIGGGRFPVANATLDKLQIGNETLKNEEVLVIDFDRAFGTGAFTCGVIGHSLLKRYQLSVNYPARVLELRKTNGRPTGTRSKTAWNDFEYIQDTHLVVLPTLLNGQGPFHLVVDTGSGGTVITPQVAERLNLSREQAAGQLKVVTPGSEGCTNGCRGLGGFADGYAVQLKSISVGSVTQDDPLVGVIDLRSVSPRGEVIRDGIIGYPFMKDLELVIDYPNKRFAFMKHATPSS